ncbi:MAG: MoxR family ATPase [Pseudomonadota bacterium]
MNTFHSEFIATETPRDSSHDASANHPYTLEQVFQFSQHIRQEIAHALVGQDTAVYHTLIALFAGGHILIEGIPGLGKTLLMRALAKTFNGGFSRIQFTPDLMPSDVTGHALYDLKTQEFNIRKGPVFTHLLLADEINRSPAKTQAALLEVMQENQVTIEGQSFVLPSPFMVMATQNSIEQEGTYPLPDAQLDRFLLKIIMGYPTAAEESQLVAAVTHEKMGNILNVDQVRTIVTHHDIAAAQQYVARILVDQRVIDYAVRITRATREDRSLLMGAGPRGAISLVRAARAAAMLAQRNFVIPEDVKSVAHAVLRHRITLSPALYMEGYTADKVLSRLVEQIEVPRQ